MLIKLYIYNMSSTTEGVFSSSGAAVCYCGPIIRKPCIPIVFKNFEIKISECPPPPIENVHICFGCWRNYDENQRRNLIVKAIISFLFVENRDIVEQFNWIKNFFITHKIYDEEEPMKFTRFWMRIYCHSRIFNRLDTLVDESGNKFITQISSNEGGGVN
jgi:hypothetical protein